LLDFVGSHVSQLTSPLSALRSGISVSVTRWWAGVDKACEQEKLEAWKTLGKCSRSGERASSEHRPEQAHWRL